VVAASLLVLSPIVDWATPRLARLWRDQAGAATRGFDTRDLKEAKVLLEEFAAQRGI
jgi:hypothetical protein